MEAISLENTLLSQMSLQGNFTWILPHSTKTQLYYGNLNTQTDGH